jgi:hypothetical protein
MIKLLNIYLLYLGDGNNRAHMDPRAMLFVIFVLLVLIMFTGNNSWLQRMKDRF